MGDYRERIKRTIKANRAMADLLGGISDRTKKHWQEELELLADAARGDVEAQAAIAVQDEEEDYGEKVGLTAILILDGTLKSEEAAVNHLHNQLGRELTENDWQELALAVYFLGEFDLRDGS